jgi:hydroxyethylthiazole kinase-like uncharacterized protein yjeF
MRVVNLQEMKAIEIRSLEEFNFSESLIVENVGIRGADFIQCSLLENESYGEIVILAGHGNNAADGLAIGRHLVNRGLIVRAFMLFPDEPYSGELKNQVELAKRYGVKISNLTSVDQITGYFNQTQEDYFILDAILGTGVRLPISNYLFEIINIANHYSDVMVSVDMPSGISGESGGLSSTAIEADYTMTIGLPKTGLYISDGAQKSGEIVTLDAGYPQALIEGGNKALLTPESVAKIMKTRNKFNHKNRFGHGLVIGGSQGLTGALVMAANSALKVGAGLVTAVTWDESYNELSARISNEIMIGKIPSTDQNRTHYRNSLEKYDSIVIGPGLGQSDEAREIVLDVLGHYSGPLVIDADAMNVLSLKDDMKIMQMRTTPIIFTPHLGEFARFIGAEVEEILERPISYVKEFVEQTNSTLILKGACTYLGFPDGKVYLNYYPNDGMATGGSGDVLAGILGGLLAQRINQKEQSNLFTTNSEYYQASCLSVMIHSLAGKQAAEKLGVRAMTANSLIENLSDAFFELESI